MRMDRRASLLAGSKSGGGIAALPTASGDCEIFGDLTKGYIKLKSSGTVTLAKGVYDICAVSSGGRGSEGSSLKGGRGGRGGYVANLFDVSLSGNYNYVVGGYYNATAQAVNHSTFGDILNTEKMGEFTTGGSGASRSPTATASASGKNGPYAFEDTMFPRVGGSGGGGGCVGTSTLQVDTRPGAVGGDGGGGKGQSHNSAATKGATNTGGGGGGGFGHTDDGDTGTYGGSGVIFIRWGYDAA